MPAPRARLLCTGDLHLGRFPSYVPPEERAFSVEEAWERAVEEAIEEAVDAVVLTGDVADQDNKVFEAFGPLMRGAERLAAAGIRTFAVAGNHDFDALRRLAGLLDPEAFTLLGAGGRWGSEVLERGGAPVLRLVGWSFPRQHVRTSPLADFPALGGELPTLGLLHADLDQPGSPYAPVALAELAAAPVAGWLLGHIHAPSLRHAEGRCVLYPGSLQPLDPGERGPHGPWIVTLRADGAVEAEQRPLATIRYDEVAVDLGEASDREEAEAAIIEAITGHLGAACREQPSLRHAVLDVRLRGRTALHGATDALAAELEGQAIPEGRATGLVRRVATETRPTYDLRAVARGHDPAALLAGLLLEVEAGAPEAQALLAEAASAIDAVDRARAYAPLRRRARPERNPEQEARTMLLEQGLRLLEQLRRQREATDDIPAS